MLEIKNGNFELDGKKINIYSGAIHYFRILPEYWENRLKKLKAAGFNTVETYVCWNLHEPSPGAFDFSGRLDIKRFLKTAQEVGLNAIVRPGPYICAEWDLGGLPAWLLADKNMRLRCCYQPYLDAVERYYRRLYEEIGDMQCTHGGNIIMMQVENEYGSYGNDKQYLEFIKNLMLDCGADTLLFTSDGSSKSMLSSGTLPDVYKTINFGSGAAVRFNSLKDIQPDAPKMCAEFWCGWFDRWGGTHHSRGFGSLTAEINAFFQADASFNCYMFIGGTNFGFTSGANYYSKYSPTVTSYDYGALLTEWGDYTPAYHAVRKMLTKKQGITPIELPPAPEFQNVGVVKLTEKAALLDNLNEIGGKHRSAMPESMEAYGQNFGMIYYETVMSGEYGTGYVAAHDVHDRAYLYVDGKKKAVFDRRKSGLMKKILGKDGALMDGFSGERRIGVLVDAMGRVNYGEHLYDRKGISGLSIGNLQLMGYDVYTLPLDNLEKLDYSKNKSDYPLFLKGKFKAASKADCFVHLDGFTKGSVFVNGFNLGRFWRIGPQKSLYLPGALLKDENEIVVLELEGCKKAEISITDKPRLG